MIVKIIEADITKLGSQVEAIVNAANEDLLGGGGVDGAIHRAAGPLLLEECKTLHGCLPGEAKVTKAYNLDYRYIIHTVGPRYYSDSYPSITLKNCYLNCLRLADELGLESIAFPSISTGAFSYPVEEAANIAMKAICSYKPKTLKYVYMVIYFDTYTLSVYENALKNALKKEEDDEQEDDYETRRHKAELNGWDEGEMDLEEFEDYFDK